MSQIFDSSEMPPKADVPAPAETEIPHTKEKVEELTSAAALQYTLKNFNASAELYSKAVEIQAELNGDLSPDNAELFFYYGRALYKAAIENSDVLGGKVAQEGKKKKAKAQAKEQEAESSSAAAGVASKDDAVANNPYFQLTGDENWTDSEDEDEAQQGEDEDEWDDFQNAYETFELARVCYEKKLQALKPDDSAEKGKEKVGISKEELPIKEKIADCHGFLAEISLEAERFDAAIADARKSLALQEELTSFEHENVGEAHYILSLALEMESSGKLRDIFNEGDAEGQAKSEQLKELYAMREEAAKHARLAVESVEALIKKEEASLADPAITLETKNQKEALIKNKKEALKELKPRVAELQTDPKSLVTIDDSMLKGLAGSLLNGDPATAMAKLQEATKSANDLSGLTRKKAKAPAPAPADVGSSKRKLEVDDEANGKRAKTEERTE